MCHDDLGFNSEAKLLRNKVQKSQLLRNEHF